MATFIYRRFVQLWGDSSIVPTSAASSVFSVTAEATAGRVRHLLLGTNTTCGGTGNPPPSPATGIDNSGTLCENVQTFAGFDDADELTGLTGYPGAHGEPLDTSPSWAASTSGKGYRFQAGGGTAATGTQTLFSLAGATPIYASLIELYDADAASGSVPMVFFNYIPVTPPTVSNTVTFNHPSGGLYFTDSAN